MFSSPVVGSAKYLGGLSRSLATSVWGYFRNSQEEVRSFQLSYLALALHYISNSWFGLCQGVGLGPGG